MKLFSSKTLRATLGRVLFFLPPSAKVSVDNWLRGRKEYMKLKQVDFAVVSLPKSGRTWLRVMLSRFYQRKLGLQEHAVIGFDNFFSINPKAPRVLFSHDYVLRSYTGNISSIDDFLETKTILLVRDPRDAVVSQYLQWRYRMTPSKRRLYSVLDVKDGTSVFDFMMNKSRGIPYYIKFMNDWHRDLHQMKDVLVVRYEDMRIDPSKVMGEVLSFVGESATVENIRDIVEYAKFENMRKLEEKRVFKTGSKRLFTNSVSDPNSFKTRRAKIGGYADHFTSEELEVINDVVREQLSPAFGYKDLL